MKQRVRACLAAGVLATTGATGATPEPAERFSVLSLSAYLDDEDSWSADIGLDVAVGDHLRTFGTVGYSTLTPGPVLAADADRDVDFAYGTVGVGYGRGGFSTDLSLGLWGDDDVVATRDLRAGAGYDTALGGIRATAVHRDLDVTVRRLVPGTGLVTEQRSTTATGVGLDLRLSPASAWRIYAGGETSDYEDRLEQLLDRVPVQLLAQRQLTLSSTFPEWAWRAGADLFLGAHRINLEHTADKSIFGGLESDATSIAWQFPLGPSGAWALDLRVGRADGELSEAVTFGLASLSLLY